MLRNLAVLGALALGALMFVPALLGLERYVVTGDSMGDTIGRGSIVFARAVPVGDLRVGDVITYTPPGHRARVTHRIVWAGRGVDGGRAFRTKGDANASADPWRFELRGRTQARVVWHVPWVGHVLSALSVRWVRVLVIGVPAALVAAGLVAGAWRDARAAGEAAT